MSSHYGGDTDRSRSWRNDDWRGMGTGRSGSWGRDRDWGGGTSNYSGNYSGSMGGGSTGYGYGGSDERIHQGSFTDQSWRRGSSGYGGSSGDFGGGFDRGSRGSGQHTGKGPKGYQRSDERIREDVSDALAAHPHVDASEIEVSVNGGEVTLTGTVDSREAKRQAEMALDEIPGVTQVHNQLRVSRGENGQNSWMQQGSMQAGSSGSTGSGSTYAQNTGGPNQPSRSGSATSGSGAGSQNSGSSQSNTGTGGSTGTSGSKGERAGNHGRSSET